MDLGNLKRKTKLFFQSETFQITFWKLNILLKCFSNFLILQLAAVHRLILMMLGEEVSYLMNSISTQFCFSDASFIENLVF